MPVSMFMWNAAPYTARTSRNITNIMYCKEDLIYKALQVDVEREHRYCKKVEEKFLQELNQKKPKSIEEVSNIWYRGRDGRNRHYRGRYHCLNLHSVFQKGTIEFSSLISTHPRRKNQDLYTALPCHPALGVKPRAVPAVIRPTSTNEKYTFRTWLLPSGNDRDEFKTARKFLLENLEEGLHGRTRNRQRDKRERLKAKRKKKSSKSDSGGREPPARRRVTGNAYDHVNNQRF